MSAIASQRPLLLILEDLHWVDTASSDLLLHLSREAAHSRMLILGTYRPDELAVSRGETVHPLAETLSELKRQHGDIWLDLGELAEADGRRFVEAYLDTQPNRLGPAFREALFTQTGGHALFTVELVRELRERGDLRQDADGQWIDGPAIDWNVLPARVEGAIEKRIQRLEQELRTILTIASVEGETFTAEVVARVQQLNERGLVQRLSQELDKQHRLVAAHILAWLGSQRLSLYRFRHHLFQQYVYHSLTAMERAYLHEAVGSVLEALYGQQTEHMAVQLARHFEQAGLTEKAVTYLLQASKRAARLSANQEVITHMTKGLALIERLPETRERVGDHLGERPAEPVRLALRRTRRCRPRSRRDPAAPGVALEIRQQPRLADAGLALDDRDRRRGDRPRGASSDGPQPVPLRDPADEPPARRLPRLEPRLAEQPADPDRPALAAEHPLAEILDRQPLAGRPAGRLVEEDLARLGEALDPGGGRDRRARSATSPCSPGTPRGAATTSPVAIPIRTWSALARDGSSRRARPSRIASAQWVARRASSSWAVGQPNTANTASPMNFSRVPSNASIASTIAPSAASTRRRTSSGSCSATSRT